ncbi:MAG: hypothetical protein E7464_08305 [Ruminococcaceae bacterium]|nr:hypothetical protein [Oscillospiraceae bacterium]
MTELELMQRAKMYMDKLAQGVDPISGQSLSDDSALNNVRLTRCFFYVADVLGRVISNGGVIGQRSGAARFVITPEQISRVKIMDKPIRITEFTELLYQAVDDPEMKRPSVKKITDWLLAKGLLVKKNGVDGNSHRIPSEQGIQMGMSTRLRQSRDGEYQAVYYDKNMQRFLLDHLLSIL